MNKSDLIRNLVKDSIQRAVQESVAAIIVIVAFGYLLQMVAVGSPQYYGCLLIMISAGFISGVVWSYALSHRMLRNHSEADEAFWHATVLNQARMLRLVPAWYLAPLCLGILLFVFPVWGEGYGGFLVMLAVVAALFAVVTWLNRRAAVKIEDLAKVFVAP